jgi:hypothetical protein
MDLKSGDLNACLTRATEWPLELAGRIQHATARHVDTGTVPAGRAI